MRNPKIDGLLVADGARARFFLQTHLAIDKSSEIALVHDHRRNAEALDGKPGSAFRNTTDLEHSFEPRINWHQYQKKLFAKEIGKLLSAMEHKFNRLTIVASPRILGLLRLEFSENISNRIMKEIPKDLTKLSTEQLSARLEGYI